jgi:hypothetical protein
MGKYPCLDIGMKDYHDDNDDDMMMISRTASSTIEIDIILRRMQERI